MISEYKYREETAGLSFDSPQQSRNEMSRADIKAGPAWIKQFMQDFLGLRLSLQR